MQVLNDTAAPPTGRPNRPGVANDDLLSIAEACAASASIWLDRLDLHEGQRSGLRILGTDRFDVWLLRWPPATSVTPHDHGDSAGAFTVVSGGLTEIRWTSGVRTSRTLAAGQGSIVERGQVHDVVSPSLTSLSVHAYSPPLTSMSYFDRQDSSFLYRGAISAEARFAESEGGRP